MDFGWALQEIKGGGKVRRAGWNGKGMWIAFSPGCKGLAADQFWSPANREFALSLSQAGKADVLPCITMKTATGEILMGWLANQTDMLSEDWEVA